MDIDKAVEYSKLLFNSFGWYSICLVVATTLIMIPVSILLKKIFKSEGTQRLRKTISAVMVYAVSIGVVAAVTAIFKLRVITFDYLISTCIPVGLLAMFLWAIIKIVRDYGFKPLLKLITKSKAWKEGIYDLGVDKKVVDLVVKNADEYLKDIDITKAENLLESTTALSRRIAIEINGFIGEEGNVTEITNKLVNAILKKYKK